MSESSPRGTAVLVHGAGGGAWEWNIWRRVFAAEGWRVETPELLPVPAGLAATRLEDYRQQLAVTVVGLTSPRVLVGASLGGLLALQLADSASALVLINPLPPSPWHTRLPGRASPPPVIPWGAYASLAGTRRAMPDADAAACLYAFRHWRDESGAALDAARAGVQVPVPTCPMLMMIASNDADVPAALSFDVAQAFSADVIRLAGASHVGPLLGKGAAAAARQAVDWLNGIQKVR